MERLMDALSDVLRTVRLTGAIFFDINASEPWVAETPPGEAIVGAMFPGSEHLICYHVITQGRRSACRRADGAITGAMGRRKNRKPFGGLACVIQIDFASAAS
jgi:cupin